LPTTFSIFLSFERLRIGAYVMKFLKYSLLIISSLTVFSSTLYAEDDVISLPTITVMAEEELRDEFVGILPYQEDEEVKEALRYQVYKLESDIQNKENPSMAMSYIPNTAIPNMNQYSPFLQQYIMVVASGFQSSDPTNGAFEMLSTLGIDRNNIDSLRNGTMEFNFNQSTINEIEKNNVDIFQIQQQLRENFTNR
jgi:hypothetical protein